jgi:mono/diheme cytochrome c family protein
VTPILAALWKNDVRHYIILLNIIVLIGLAVYLAYAVLSPRRARAEERSAPNATPFLDDEALESRRLERVLAWSLLFAAVSAVALPLYWLREPTRQSDSETYFDENAVERGATLYANASSEHYDSATSLQCANCHGSNGEGGTAPFTVDGKSVSWVAPALNTELLRFSEEEVRQIITFGRPGTPMQPWGVEGGGPKNEQAINDLIAYIHSIQLTPDEAKRQAEEELAAAKEQAAGQVESARKEVTDATSALGEARTALRTALGLAGADDAALTSACEDIRAEIDRDPEQVDREQAAACGDYLEAVEGEESAQASLDWALEWQQRRANVSDGQYVFELYCARCHTEGWSIFDPSEPNGVDVLGLAGGGGGAGGGIGFNLRDGAEIRRFGTDEQGGFDLHREFVGTGSDEHKAYGRGGIGSGRMPGFSSMLTDDMLDWVVAYERYCLDVTTYTGTTPACDTTEDIPRVPATTTTTRATSGG